MSKTDDTLLATLSFLELVWNWPKKRILNLALCCGAIWCHREKTQHRCTTTVHPAYNCSKKILENLLHVGLLVHTNLFIQSRFWTTNTNFDTCWQHYVATCGKISLYRCISTVSDLNYCSRFFFKSLQLPTQSAAHKLFHRFLDFFFAIFDCNFVKILAPPSNEYVN